jgi:hypothetical protein
MTEEYPSESIELGSDTGSAAAEESSSTNGQEESASAEAAPEPPESHTKSVLRQAIEKVMEEITQHEKEAQKHMQRANALRRELRESVAFLQDQGSRAKPTLPREKAAEPKVEGKSDDAASKKRPPAAAKKKAGGKGKKS